MADHPHYSSTQARAADLGVHLLGLVLSLLGGVILLWLCLQEPAASKLPVVAVYSAGVVAMFAFSTASKISPLVD